MDDTEAEKVARNNAVFREANDEIATSAADLGLGDGRPVPFICECGDPQCATVISLTLPEYQRVRSNSHWFAHANGHATDLPGIVRTVERHDGFTLVEKLGHAAEIVTRLAEHPER